jgi:hypothetical protein
MTLLSQLGDHSLNLAQFAVLCGIYLRLGRLVAEHADLKRRVTVLEGKPA